MAKSQLDKEALSEPTAGRPTTSAAPAGDSPEPTGGTAGGTHQATTPNAEQPKPRRFHGSVILDATRVGRDASRIADEVISHLSGLVGATVRVSLEIEAEVGSGVPDNVVRTVTENSRTLKFTTHGFEGQ